MDRRTNLRMELQLVCHVGPEKILSRPVGATTQNVSRNGMLMHWTQEAPLPSVGSRLSVEVDLPANADFGPRVMKCRTTVVRIIPGGGSDKDSVALRINSMRFAEGPAGHRSVNLNHVASASKRVN
jgi:hypothetical protein